MHPILARGGRLALYLGAWFLVGLLFAALLSGQGVLSPAQSLLLAIPLAVTYAFFCLSSWYVSRSMPLAATGAIRILTTAVTAAVMSSAAWLALARAWMGVLARRSTELDAAGVFARVGTLIFGFGLLLYLLSLAVSYLLGSFEQSRETERRGLQVQVLAREAELRSLRAQIDPHFLFNSLNSISALTASDAAAARRMCVLLADFLRDSLTLGAEDRIPVDRELSMARRFLEIERVRFGDRLQVALSAGGAESCLVPPLLLQPLVENAVTHGVAPLLAGGLIRVIVSRSASTLSIAVENPCDPDRPRRTGTGLGLANVPAQYRPDRARRAVRKGQPGCRPARRQAPARQPSRLRAAGKAVVDGSHRAGMTHPSNSYLDISCPSEIRSVMCGCATTTYSPRALSRRLHNGRA